MPHLMLKEEHWDILPSHMREPMRLYLEHGVDPGSFLTAVLENNLSEAIARADHINRFAIGDIVNFLQWYVPSVCWGSPSAVSEWVKQHIEARRTD